MGQNSLKKVREYISIGMEGALTTCRKKVSRAKEYVLEPPYKMTAHRFCVIISTVAFAAAAVIIITLGGTIWLIFARRISFMISEWLYMISNRTRHAKATAAVALA